VVRLSVLQVCDAVPVGIWFPTFRDKELVLKSWEPNTKNIPEEIIPQTPITWVISGFPRDVTYMRSVLFWNIMQRRALGPWSLNTRPLGCPETSERNYHSILHNIPQRVQISCNFFEAFIRWAKLGIYVGIMVKMSLFTAWGHARLELHVYCSYS